MTWTFLALLAAFLWACSNIVDKYVQSKLVSVPVVPLIVWSVIGLCIGSGFFALKIATPVSFPFFLAALAAGGSTACSIYCYFNAVRIADISRVIPLYYLSPIFVAVMAALFLGEIFTPQTYVGILLIVGGAVLLSRPASASFIGGKPLRYMICAAFLFGASEVITKYLLGFASVATVFASIRLGSFICSLPLIIIYFPALRLMYREKGVKAYAVISLNEVLFGFTGTYALAIAVKNGFVTLVNSMASFQPFFVLLFSVLISVFRPHVLKEEVTRSNVTLKLCAIILMFTGATLVSRW